MRSKATNKKVTLEFLDSRVSPVYGKQKWILFCEILLSKGYELSLYEARRTRSKYITIKHPCRAKKSYKVRFSDHKPIKGRELAGDCDFFVGMTHTGVRTYKAAISAVEKFFLYPPCESLKELE